MANISTNYYYPLAIDYTKSKSKMKSNPEANKSYNISLQSLRAMRWRKIEKITIWFKKHGTGQRRRCNLQNEMSNKE
jgi:hypothetical protein